MTVTRRGCEARVARGGRTGFARWAAHAGSAIGALHQARESAMNSGRPIVVAGAGSIGCFVGGMLAAGGHRVALLARPRVIGEIAAHGLRLTSFDGFDRTIAASALSLSDNPSIFGDAAVVLATVKSADTAGMADTIASHAPDDAIIVSLQNRFGNVAPLRARLGGRRVLGAPVPSNVLALGGARLHRSPSAVAHAEHDPALT